MNDVGFIKLYRRLIDSPVASLPGDQFKVAVFILLLANWKDGRTFSGGSLVEVRRGELMTSRDSLAKRAGVSAQTVRSAIDNLRRCGFLTSRSTSRYTLLCVTNYERYQGEDYAANQPVNQPANQALTSRQPSANHDRRREEGKKGRNTSSSAPPQFDFEAVYQLYPRKAGKKLGLAKLRKLVKAEADYTSLLSAVERMSREWQGEDTTYCPHFSTFVNQERWRDGALPLPSKQSPSRREPLVPRLKLL